MGHYHQHHQAPPPTHTNQASSKSPQTEGWEPRTKLIAGLLSVFGVISLNDLRLLLVALAFAILLAGGAGLTCQQLFVKLMVLLPFLGLMSIPLLFSAGYPPQPAHIHLAVQILLKGFTAMVFTLFVFINQPIEEILEAMKHLKVPAALTTVLYLTYRYGFLFWQEMETTLKALKARLFGVRLSRQSLLIYGELSGGLLIKSLNRSETVYRAMAARGFQGTMPVGIPRPIKARDLIKAALPLLVIMVLIIIDQVVL